jgi:hypothetical protein
MMIEHLGIDGLVPPDDDDADIRDEFACAGREAIFGFDAMGGIFARPASLAVRESCPNLPRYGSAGGRRSSAAAQLLLP